MLAKIGGMHTIHLFFLKAYEPNAPINVARLPKITSKVAAPQKRLDKKQPKNTPGTAAGVK